MILADEILAQANGPNDLGGMLASMAKSVRLAERFVLTDDVALAGYRLIQSKPLSLLEALPLTRFPFPRVWLEWNGDASNLAGWELRPWIEREKGPAVGPPRRSPLRMGCLIETDDSGRRGAMTWAWQHRDTRAVTASGIGVMFDYTEGGDVFEWGLSTLAGDERAVSALRRLSRPVSEERLTRVMVEGHSGWKSAAKDQRQRDALRQLERHHCQWNSPHSAGAFDVLAAYGDDVSRQIIEAWQGDVTGEGPFVNVIMVMLNSRNALEHEPADLARLNKARARTGKPPILAHSVTRLRLTRARQRDATASGMSRADMRAHLVRGHFKIRRTGVYWWSPFVRGTGAVAARARYDVQL